MSSIKDRIAAAKAAQRQAERDRYKDADRSAWRKPATQDPNRYAVQVDRLRRTGNTAVGLAQDVYNNAVARRDALVKSTPAPTVNGGSYTAQHIEQRDAGVKRKEADAAVRRASYALEAAKEAERLRGYRSIDDVQALLDNVQRERERVNLQMDQLGGNQSEADPLGASADYTQWLYERLQARAEDLGKTYDLLAEDYKAVAQRESDKLTGDDYRAWVEREQRRAADAEAHRGVSYTAPQAHDLYSTTATDAIKGREVEYYKKTIDEAEQIRQSDAYKQWEQEHGASFWDALHATATQAEYAANRGSYGTDGAIADTIGTLVGGHVGKVAGKAIAGEYADMAQDEAYKRLRDAAMMRTYLRETKGKKAADEYWHAVRGIELAEAARKGMESAQKYAKAAPGMASVSSIVGQIESIAPNLIGMGKAALGTTFEGFAPTYYDSTLAGQREVGTIRGTVEDSIDSPVGKWLYSNGMSLADNAVRAALSAVGVPTWVTSLMASGTAAGSSMQSALDKGVSADKALVLGTVSAVTEYATEHMGIDAWYDAINTGGKTAVKRAILAALKDMPAEGTEEVISEAVNMIAEAAVLGDASDLRQAVEAHKAQGFTDAGAMAAAIGSRLGEAFVGGALAGAVLGGTGSAINYAVTPEVVKQGLRADKDSDLYKAADAVYRAGTGSNPLVQLGMERLSDAQAGNTVTRKALVDASGGKLSDADAVALVDALQSGNNKRSADLTAKGGLTEEQIYNAAIAGERATNLRSDVRDDLRTDEVKRSANKVDRLTESIYKAAYSVTLTNTETRALRRSKASTALVDKYKALVDSGGDIEPAQNRDTISKIASESKISTDGKAAVAADDGTATPISIDSVRVSNGQVQVVTDDGTSYDPADVTFADDVQAYTVAWASQMGADATHAYQTISALPRTGGADPLAMVKQFTSAYEWAHYYGAVGTSQQKAMDSSLTQALPEEQRLRAYEAGRILADTKLQQDIKTAAERKRAVYKGVDTSKVSDKTMSSLTADQTYTLAVADLLSKAGKVNIVVMEAMDKGFNGGYQASTNTIMLNINAFNVGNSTGVRWTLAHELTHFAKAWAPAEWDAYKAAMLKVLEDKGTDIARLTEHYKRLYAKHGQRISDDDALEEVICQGAQEMLENSKYIEQLAREDKNLFQKILDALKKILEAVNRLVTGKNPDPTALAVQSEVQSLVDQWDSALKAALERSAGAGTEATEVTEMTAEEMAYAEIPHEMTAEQMAYGTDAGMKWQITPTEDEAYMAAVNSGDMETAQRLVDEAAEKAGAMTLDNGNIKHYYHGTNSKFTSFEAEKSRYGTYGYGFYFSPTISKASEYGELKDVYLMTDRIATRLEHKITAEQVRAFLDRYSIGLKDSVLKYADTIEEWVGYKNDMSIILDLENWVIRYTKFDTDKLLADLIEVFGYDGVRQTNETVLWNNKLIKSADPVTYDDNGNVISLSQRFNTDSDDIRWQLTPTDSLGLTAEELLASVDPETIGNKETRRLLTEYQTLYTEYKGKLDAAGGNMKGLLGLRDKVYAKMRLKALQDLESRVRAHMTTEAARYHQAEVDINVDWYIAEQTQKYGKKIDELTQKYRDMLVRQRDRKNDQILKESLRDSIRKQVKALHKTLTTDTAQKHVPQKLKMYAAEALAELTNTKGIFRTSDLAVLADLYKGISNNTAEDALYDESLMEQIDQIHDVLRDKSFSELNPEELQTLRDVLKSIRKRIQTENEMFAKGRKDKFDEVVNRTLAELNSTPRRKIQKPVAKWMQELLYTGNLKPVYFFRRIGGELQKLYQSLLDGQNNVFARDQFDDDVFLADLMERTNYDAWADKKDDILVLKNGDKEYTLTREQAMSIYATWKREAITQKTQHLSGGGFVYQDEISKRIPKKAKGEKVDKEYLLADVSPHPVTAKNFEDISKWLTDDQKRYADEAVAYLSDVVSARGNEVSMALSDIKLFNESYYFPFEVSSDFIARKAGESSTQKKAPSLQKNKGFTKQTQNKAAAPVVLRDFTEVVREHMAEMNMYHAEALPQLDFWRVLNYKNGQVSVKNAIRAAYGENAVEYINNLLGDINHQLVADYRENAFTRFAGNYKFARTAASMSVILQQPSSMVRAMGHINPRYFVGLKPAGKKAHDEMLQYSGAAVIKSMGGFDTNTSRGAAEWIGRRTPKGVKAKAKAFFDPKDNSFRNDLWGWGAMKADALTWTVIWNAVKRETKAHMGVTENTEAVLKAAGKRFDEVIELTQVYDSVLSRSQHMRAKGKFASMVTAFAAENTVTLNMLFDALTYRGAGRVKHFGAAVFSVIMSIFANSLLKSLVTASRDKEEKPWLEKYMDSVSENFFEGINPIGMFVWVKDLWSIIKGYDVERADMSLLAEVYTTATKAFKALEDGSTTFEDDLPYIADAVAAVGDFLNIPATNLLRDGRAIYNNVVNFRDVDQTVDWERVKQDFFANASYGWYNPSDAGVYNRMYRKLKQGDTAAYNEKRQAMVKKKTAQLIAEGTKESKALKQAEALVDCKMKQMIRKDYEEKRLTLDESEKLLKKYGLDDSAEDIYFTSKEWEYEQSSDDQYSRYGELYAAMDAGKNVTAFVKELTSHGYKEEDVLSSMKSHIGSLYREGELTRTQAEQKLSKYVGEDEHEIFWSLDRWDYTIAHDGDSEGYSKYLRWVEAVRTGKNLRETIRFYVEHDVDKKALASAITREFKEEYLALKEKGKASTLKGYLLNAYARLYGADFDRAKKSKDIDSWKLSEEEEN